ncbi:hypothetical protein CDD81_3016 [Ophiocordyceps australis]|uniref:Uncharacterized protein n=1 Tax=Ophiocordyceps australis TaxID=1399860 RepID=A0A2C5YEU4_9HYPO|nr:hypothetical protein CDD81_3016 [Ophiocordyceps australis]
MPQSRSVALPRHRPFESMSHTDYDTVIFPKVAGAWILNKVALETDYAAASVLLDSFAYYRPGLGLKANSVNLAAIEDVDYMSEYVELIAALDASV